ncbi:hypothetical protein A2U01_0088894, partial [Trifolium medium]|nr:hypothetical protein [Trifolium medium]
SVELDETDMMSITSDDFRVNPDHLTPKKEGPKKTPKRSSKKKRKKWKNKWEKLTNSPGIVTLLLVDHNVTPLKEEQKRDRVE